MQSLLVGIRFDGYRYGFLFSMIGTFLDMVSLGATVRLLHHDLGVKGSKCGNSFFACRDKTVYMSKPSKGGSLLH